MLVRSFKKKESEMITGDHEVSCSLIGTCCNQDGRSATLTAPNGPAQQMCIRGSMKNAGLSVQEISQAECHGTGTALGDPIEVGSLTGCMEGRRIPLYISSSKSNMGHLEAAAGLCGLMKCCA